MTTTTAPATTDTKHPSQGNVSEVWSGIAVLGFVLSFAMPIVGLVLSILGFKQVTATGDRGRGLALAGIIISGAALAFTAIWILVAIAGSIYVGTIS